MKDTSVRSSWWRLIALALGLVMIAAACGSDSDGNAGGGDATEETTTTEQPEATPVKGGELVFATESDVSTLEPGKAAQPADKVITLGIFDPLTTYVDGKIEPYLAESLEGTDDLLTYTMKLRSGVTFHDGTPLNADAVVKHFDRLKDPATACSCASLVSIITSMDVPDGAEGLTVVFHLAEPSVAFPDLLAGSSGYVESPTAVANLGAGFANAPVGTGPFVLKEFTPGERVVLEAYPGYWKQDDNGIQLPYLDKLTIVPIADSGQRVSALKAGDIDIFQTADSATVASAEKDGFAAQKISGSSSTIILLNNAKPPFDDVRARQALAYAINKDAINERVYDGVREPSYSGFATDSPFYNPDAGTPKYDPDKAKELVDELGGLKFSLVCIPTPEADGILQLVKQMGEQVGMEIELQTQEQGAYVQRMFSKSGDYEAGCFRSSHFIEPDAIRPGLTTGDTGNLVFYSNPEVDKLLDEGRRTADLEKRKEAYFRVQEITGQDVPLITTLYDLFGNVYNADKVGPPPPGEANSLGAIKPGYLYAVG
ncbi:MAG TPA: ABC transporter substrate-binding protein [Acidimicrobiales bacterium]|nr:ABC transporter substrate-binding protein [Acidimicrobiales bacterium]